MNISSKFSSLANVLLIKKKKKSVSMNKRKEKKYSLVCIKNAAYFWF